MKNGKTYRKFGYTFCTFGLLMIFFLFGKLEAEAVDFPNFNVSFEAADESVVVDGIPANSSDGTIEYQLEGYLNFGKERVETFCYAPNVCPYDVPHSQAYIFNWSGDAEFLLPCSGEYQFTAYITARYVNAQGIGVEESGPKTTISIYLNKKDESTNWGPGLPNTTVEDYDLGQIKGKDKTIKVEETDYIWSIYGKDILQVPEGNISLKITSDPTDFQDMGVKEFFGDTPILKWNIEHDGEFGFQAVLDYKLGEEYAGKYANLFYVVGDGTFEYLSGSVVTESGTASFVFTHASDYVLAITEEEYTGQDLARNLKEEQEKEIEEAETKTEVSQESHAEETLETTTHTEDAEPSLETEEKGQMQRVPDDSDPIETIGTQTDVDSMEGVIVGIVLGVFGVMLIIAIGIIKKKK